MDLGFFGGFRLYRFRVWDVRVWGSGYLGAADGCQTYTALINTVFLVFFQCKVLNLAERSCGLGSHGRVEYPRQ